LPDRVMVARSSVEPESARLMRLKRLVTSDLKTPWPTLLVDLDLAEENIDRMTEYFNGVRSELELRASAARSSSKPMGGVYLFR